MINFILKILIGLCILGFLFIFFISIAKSSEARDEIRIVGSSTVFPFVTAVAEEFGRAGGYKTPVVESTGTGGGFKLFCSNVTVDSPDIVNASRRIKKSEIEMCAKNGVVDIHEVKIGFDGIVLAHAKGATPVKFTLAQIWQALAKDVIVDGKIVPNPYKMWSEIDGSLPATKIEVIGPPPTSGTRDAFNELAIEGGCKTFPEVEALKKEDEKKYKALCQSVREDGAYIEAGENDNLIIQKITINENAYGVFGYSFFDQNRDKLDTILIDDTEPSYENISSGAYSISRSLYFYVKKAHIGVIPGLKEYVDLWTLESTFGPEGFLVDKGLIVLPDDQREAQRASSAVMENIAMMKDTDADTDTDAAAFITRLGSRAIDIMKSAQSTTFAQREAEFRILLEKGFDLKMISRFIIGKHWREATDEQKEAYDVVFADFITRVYAARFNSYGGETFNVIQAVNNSSDDVWVRTKINRLDGGQPISVDYRVRLIDGVYKVVDVIVEGISMINTHRIEFASVINKRGFDGLISELKSRLN